MGRPWQLIVVRAWHLGEERIIRLTTSGDAGLGRTMYVTSSRSAGDQLRRWLDELVSGPTPGSSHSVLTELADKEPTSDEPPGLRAVDGRETKP